MQNKTCTWIIPENKVWLAVNLEFDSPAVVNISSKGKLASV
jgi:hypothetical protein